MEASVLSTLACVLAVILQNFVFLVTSLKKVSAKDSAEKMKQMMCIEFRKNYRKT